MKKDLLKALVALTLLALLVLFRGPLLDGVSSVSRVFGEDAVSRVREGQAEREGVAQE